MKLSILYVGPQRGTCEHRAKALAALGHELEHIAGGPPTTYWPLRLYAVGNRLNRPPDLLRAGRRMLEIVSSRRVDVLWIDKGREIDARVLARVRRLSPSTIVVAYSPDDMMNPRLHSIQYAAGIPHYHLHVTTKSYNVAELIDRGAQDVLFVDNAYDPDDHRPIELSPEERETYSADVGFIGSMEADRAEQMWRLADNGVDVTVWGGGWDRFPKRHERLHTRQAELWGLKYAKAINATRINLAFLRKANRDLQTTRSIEIPACGAFMLAERTDEHLQLFEEGKEAEFFSGYDELERKCRYYTEHETERARVAAAGLERCRRGRYDNEGRMARVMDHVIETHFRGRS